MQAETRQRLKELQWRRRLERLGFPRGQREGAHYSWRCAPLHSKLSKSVCDKPNERMWVGGRKRSLIVRRFKVVFPLS